MGEAEFRVNRLDAGGTLVNFPYATQNRILASPQQPQGADDQMMAFTLVTTEKKFNTESSQVFYLQYPISWGFPGDSSSKNTVSRR